VLRGKVKPLSFGDIVARVKKAGFKTKAKNLPNMVSNTLAQMAGVKKVGRAYIERKTPLPAGHRIGCGEERITGEALKAYCPAICRTR
jgi:hypothetical protein